jgi:hypothetical protein
MSEHKREDWDKLSDAGFERMCKDYPVGKAIEIDDNICECGLWTVGESRCSCGNRRIYLTSLCKDLVGPEGD